MVALSASLKAHTTWVTALAWFGDLKSMQISLDVVFARGRSPEHDGGRPYLPYQRYWEHLRCWLRR
jgi:hypothetical protein